jgi:hypothetical protein
MPGASFMTLAADPCGGNDAFTKILLHMDGANAGTTFTDNNIGGSAHTWTAASATTSSTQFKFGSTSLSDGASAGAISTPSSTDFNLGSGDFTIDCWFWVNAGAGTARFLCGTADASATTASQTASIGLTTGNVLQFRASLAASTNVTGTTAFTTTGWHHVAGVRVGNILRLFVDGVQEGGDVAFTGAVNACSTVYGVGTIGAFAGNVWNGFVDEFRLSVGIARWTAAFAPPAAPYFCP